VSSYFKNKTAIKYPAVPAWVVFGGSPMYLPMQITGKPGAIIAVTLCTISGNLTDHGQSFKLLPPINKK
jgi:hypothetical protein